MINFFKEKVALFWKYMFYFAVIASLLSSVFIGMYFIQVDPKSLHSSLTTMPIRTLFLRVWSISLWVGVVATLLLYLRSKRHMDRLNLIIKEALSERKLDISLDELYSAKNIVSSLKNLEDLLELLKSFDRLKSSRMSLEFTSLKTLMNTISEGVILVNAHKVVTHINQKGNELLKLIPGEILDQSISRKVNHPVILDRLDRALKKDEKTTDAIIEYKEGISLKLNIFPIKNKFGEVVRSILIFEEERFEEEKVKEKGKKS